MEKKEAICTQSLLTISGADCTKNTKLYKNVKIETHKIKDNKKVRIMSLFNTGLTLFHMAFNSLRYPPFNPIYSIQHMTSDPKFLKQPKKSFWRGIIPTNFPQIPYSAARENERDLNRALLGEDFGLFFLYFTGLEKNCP